MGHGDRGRTDGLTVLEAKEGEQRTLTRCPLRRGAGPGAAESKHLSEHGQHDGPLVGEYVRTSFREPSWGFCGVVLGPEKQYNTTQEAPGWLRIHTPNPLGQRVTFNSSVNGHRVTTVCQALRWVAQDRAGDLQRPGRPGLRSYSSNDLGALSPLGLCSC